MLPEQSCVLPASTRAPPPDRKLLLDAGGAWHLALPLLVESLLHDARNALNALSINVEVLSERLRREAGGELPPAYEKNVRAIREQLRRVDEILRRHADFLAPRSQAEPIDLARLVHESLEVLGHEARKRKLKVQATVESPSRVRVMSAVANAVALHALLRGICRSPVGGELFVALRREDDVAVLRIEDQGGDSDEGAETLLALSAWSESQRGRLRRTGGGVVEIHLPLA